jgi:hypothetical protein
VIIPGYTVLVKTAISVPEDTYNRASQRARELGMSRSEFFSRAASRYLDQMDIESVTSEIDQAVDVFGGGDDTVAEALAVGRRLLEGTDDKW